MDGTHEGNIVALVHDAGQGAGGDVQPGVAALGMLEQVHPHVGGSHERGPAGQHHSPGG